MPTDRWDADDAVTQLYAAHYAPLVRLAALLVRHSGEAEEVVQDAFVAMHGQWRRLREPDRALGYLRRTVVNGARSTQRRHNVATRHVGIAAHALGATEPSAEDRLLDTDTRRAVLAGLDTLSPRQREVLVLRYYSDLSEHDIAETLGISQGAVKSHASRGIHSLRQALEELR